MDNHVPQSNPKKLFVGNLPYSTTEDVLTELFSPFGEIVELRVIFDRATGRSKGIAFVEYATEDQANKAIDAMSGYELDGRALIVNVARPQVPREKRDFGGGYGGGYGGGDRRGGRGGGGGYQRGGYRGSRD
jgi:RNA recognition motif-containing protein